MTTHAVQRRREARGARASRAYAVCQRHERELPVLSTSDNELEPQLHKCRGAPTNGLKAEEASSLALDTRAAQSYSSSWTRSARRSRLPRRTSHWRSTHGGQDSPVVHQADAPRSSLVRIRGRARGACGAGGRRHCTRPRPMWQAVGAGARLGNAAARVSAAQPQGAMGQRGAAGGTGEPSPNARRGTRAHVPSAYRRRCGREEQVHLPPRTNLAVPTVRVADPNAFFERSAKWRESASGGSKRRSAAPRRASCKSAFAAHATRERHAGGRRRAAPQVAKASFAASSPGSGAAALRWHPWRQHRSGWTRGAGTTGAAPAREPATGCAACTSPAAAAVTECVRNPRNAETDARQRTTPTAPSRHRRTARSARPRPPRSASPRAIASSHRHGLRARFPGRGALYLTPRVNRVPRRLSEAAAGHLGDGAFDRLSRVPPPPPTLLRHPALTVGAPPRQARGRSRRVRPPPPPAPMTTRNHVGRPSWVDSSGTQRKSAKQSRRA